MYDKEKVLNNKDKEEKKKIMIKFLSKKLMFQ